MTKLERIDILWQLLAEAHPEFCIHSRDRHSATSLLTEPKNTEEVVLLEFEKAKEFYENLLAQTEEELTAQMQKYSARREAAFEAKHPFNQPPVLATEQTYQFWSRAEFWTLEEAAILINDRNPSALSEFTIKQDRTPAKITFTLRQTLELLERAHTVRSLYASNTPVRYIEWLELKRLEIPERLKKLSLEFSATPFSVVEENKQLKEKLTALEAKEGSNLNIVEAVSLEKPLGSRERESLLKLIIGMAMQGYSYDPKATKSSQVSEIASDLQLLGLALDEDTVRKYLNEAKAHFIDILTEQNH